MVLKINDKPFDHITLKQFNDCINNLYNFVEYFNGDIDYRTKKTTHGMAKLYYLGDLMGNANTNYFYNIEKNVDEKILTSYIDSLDLETNLYAIIKFLKNNHSEKYWKIWFELSDTLKKVNPYLEKSKYQNKQELKLIRELQNVINKDIISTDRMSL